MVIPKVTVSTLSIVSDLIYVYAFVENRHVVTVEREWSSLSSFFFSLAPKQRQELLSGLLLVAEAPQHTTGGGARPQLLHPARHHTHVQRLDHHRHPSRLEHVGERHRDLLRQPLLHLEPAQVHLRQPGQFREAQHPFVGDVADVALTEKRHQVVFA